MRTLTALFALVLWGCGGSPQNYVMASGAFSGTSAKATIDNFAVALASGPGYGPTPIFGAVEGLIGAPPPDLQWTLPAGVTSSELQVGVAFNTSSPATGTFNDTDANDCGGAAITYAIGSTPDTFQANNTVQSPVCPQGQSLGPGSWSLNLTTVSPISGTDFFTIHGFFKATLIDTNQNSGTLSLTF